MGGGKMTEREQDGEGTSISKLIDSRMTELTSSLAGALRKIGDEIKVECKKKIVEEMGLAEKRLNDKWDYKDKMKDKQIKELEMKVERMERSEKRNNIILWGMRAERGKEKEAVSKFLEEKMEVKVSIEKAWMIKDKAVGIQIKTFEEKKKVMEKRAKLKGTDIVLGDDMTDKEREMQKVIKNKAMEEKKNDPDIDVRITYGKLKVGKIWYRWDEEQKKLVLFREE